MDVSNVQQPTKEWHVPAMGEFRFEVDSDQTVTVRLTSGTAEVFGAEMAPNREYSISGQKVAAFTFDGAVLSVTGKCAVEYVSTGADGAVSVPAYLNLHRQLEAERAAGRPPTVLIIGSGRNTLARTLLNYAVRAGGQPLWASLDVRTNPLFFPGTLSANLMTAVVEADEPGLTGGLSAETTSPLSLFFGSTAISDNRKLWSRLLVRLGASLRSRPNTTGCIVVAPGEEAIGDDPGTVEEMRTAVGAEWIVVIGSERAHARLQRHFATTPAVRVVKLPRSGGLVPWPRPGEQDRAAQHRHFSAYFYGPKKELNPFSTTVSFDSLSLFRILLGDADIAPSSALPLGAARKLDECRAVRVDPSSSLLLYSLVAIYHIPDSQSVSKKTDPLTDGLTDGNAAGFLYVTAVDEERRTVTVLSPCPGEPPSRIWLLGRLKWIE